MKKQLSLKLSVALAFLFLGIVIVLAYSAISRHFFILGMDNIVSANMEQAAKSYIDTQPTEKRQHNNEFGGYDISHDWSQQPTIIQQKFNEPKQANQLYKFIEAPWFSSPDVIHFLISLNINGEDLYISKTVLTAESSKLIGANIKQSKELLFIISSGIIFALALIIWLMLRRVSQPVSQLADWTHSLNSKTLNDAPPDFYYPELNEMASLIRTSLSSAQQSLEREERFLGFASHELRTPISVVRNNIELLAKLKQSSTIEVDPKFDHIIDRIDRASLTMKNLSETLLWLSRDNHDDLSLQSISLDQITEQLVDESRYLLTDKMISVSVAKQLNSIIVQPEHPVRIVLGNLIRNAFQHTQQGEITIIQIDNTITIINQHDDGDDYRSNELGFGLGLQLTSQLTEKLGWGYSISNDQKQYKVVISFVPRTNSGTSNTTTLNKP
jgi:signal transduction histidine kinase